MKVKQVTQPTVKKLNLVLNQRSEEFKKEKTQVILLSKSIYKKLCKELHYKLKYYKGIKIESI
jgi:hypothetical protein